MFVDVPVEIARQARGNGPREPRETDLRIVPVSTKLYSRARTPDLFDTVAAFVDLCCWNKSDCRRVLTTSNGAVTTEPHMPPSLHRGDRPARQLSTRNGLGPTFVLAHPPASK